MLMDPADPFVDDPEANDSHPLLPDTDDPVVIVREPETP
jgi:hypothetical protein